MKNSHFATSQLVNPREVFVKLLKRLSAADLKTFIENTVAIDESFLHRFIIQFIEGAGLSSEQKYPVILDSIIQLSASGTKDEFQQEMENLFTKAEQMIDQKNFLDEYLMAAAIIRKGSEDFIVPGLIASWDHFVTRSFDLLVSIAKSEAGFDLKEKVFDFLLTDAKAATAAKPPAIREKWLYALLETATEENQLNTMLDLIRELSGENRSQSGTAKDESEEEYLLKMKLLVLQKLNKSGNVRRLLEANKHIKTFRRQLVEDSLQQQDLEHAKELIKEGKQVDERKGKIYVGTEWDELLLKIALEEQDTKAIRNLALQLFITTGFDFDYYHLLKKHYDPSRWKSQVDRIVTHIKKESGFHTKGIHAVAKIFIEEQEWAKLLLLLQKNANLEFIELYFEVLKEKFPQELLEIYRRALRRYAEKFMGTEAYRTVTNTLKKMQSLRGGRELVQSFAIELKVDYRQRKSFVTELNKLAL